MGIFRLRKLQSSIKSKEQRQSQLKVKREAKRRLTEATAAPILNARKPPLREPDLVEPERLTGELRTVNTNGKCLRRFSK